MKHLKLFFALFAMLALGVGNAWAETVEFDLTTKTQLTTQTANSVVFTNGGATLTITKSASGTAVNNYMPGGATNASHTRVYKTNPITFDVGTGNKIQSVTVKVTSSSGSIDKITGGTWSPTVTTSGSSPTITYALSTAAQTASVTPSGTSRIEKVTLTYSTAGGSEPDPTTVTITLDQTTLSLQEGNNATLTATVTGSSDAVTWTSSAPTIATVDNGVVTALTAGEATITAAIGDVKATCAVTVTAATTPEEPGTGGEALSHTWDLSKKTYSAASTTQVTWSATDVNMVVDKASAQTNANNYLPTSQNSSRFYKNSKLTITPAANVTITSVVFTATSTGYASALQGSTWTNASASVSGTTVTVTPTNGASAISATIGGTCGFTGVTVHYTKATSGEPEPVIVKTLKAIEVTGMTTTFEQGDIFKFDGTCTATYSVTKDGVAQADETAEVTHTSVSTPNMNTVGTQTITVTYETVSTTYDITITENEVTPGTYNVLLDHVLWNVASGQQTASVESMSGKANDITFYTTKGSSQMYANATQTRFYKDQTFTISVPEGYLIKSITFAEPASDKKWEGSITVNTGTYTDGTKTWTGSAQEVTYTFGAQNRIANAEITYEVAPVEPTKTLTSIEITTPATQITFWQGETFNYNGLVVTAHYSDAADEVVTPTVTGSTATAGTATVNVSYKEQSTNYDITVKAIPNTKETAYTVADAYDIIDKLTTANGVFISGTISQIDSYSDQYKSITYWISADGTTTNQLQAYSGKGLEKADFTAVTDLSVGDQVIVCGNLKKFEGTYEFDKNNYLAEHTKTTKADPELSYTTTEYNVNLGDAFTAPTLNNPHTLAVTYSSSNEDVVTVAADGAITIKAAGTVTITASFAGNDDYVAGEASYTINITDPNVSSVTFDATIDKTADAETLSLTKDVITMTFTGGAMNNGENYRCYKNQTLTISATDASIQKIEFECTSSNPISGFADATGLDKTNSVWIGNAKSVELTASNNQVRMSKVNVYYKKDKRANAELAWSEETVSLTVGDAFTAPTLSNPKGLTVSFESSNTDLATVSDAGVISLVSGKTGTATITATFADGHADYKPAKATCVITVSPKSEKVVILAQYNGQWYALQAAYFSTYTNRLAALPVNYVGGKLYNVEEADKATIEWQLAISGTKATFKNGENYLTGTNGTDLKLGTATFEWDYNGELFLTDGDSRTFIYHKDGYFRNYATSNAIPNSATYSNKPVVTAPVYGTGDAYGRSVNLGEDGYRYGTICLPFGSTNFTGAEFFECVGKEEDKVYIASVTTLVAGTPYIFLASATEVAVYGDGTTAATPGSKNGLIGTFTDNTEVIANDDNHILLNNELRKVAATCWVNAYRAYIVMSEVPTGVPTQMPGRRYIGMSVQGENEATGFENITAPAGKTVKAIVNGQLIIIRDGEMYNAQGVRF